MSKLQDSRYKPTYSTHALACLLLCLSILISAPVQATKINSKFVQIPASSLSDSLRQIAIAYQVSYSSDPTLLNNKESPTISGSYTLSQALKLLLDNTTLSFKIKNNGFVIYKSPSQKTIKLIEEITVKGIRYSQARSRNLKHSTKAISEAISAQDITDIPNTNLAEALQYIPGVAITREAGEGRQVSIRGSYPDFSLVTLNDMPVLANNDSPMDSRVQKQRDRSFDFNILPAELFKQIQVFKSYSSDQIAGGISGTMALKTISPLDKKGFNFVITPEIGYNDYVGSGSKRYSTLLSNTWGNWGALASVAYTSRESLEQGANTFRWRNIAINHADLSSLSKLQSENLAQGNYIIPRGNRYSVWQGTQQRFGTNLSLEYKNSTSHIDVDVLSGFLKGNRSESHLYPRGDQSTPVIKEQTAITSIKTNKDNELVYAHYVDARVATESRVQKIDTSYHQGQFSIVKKLNKRWDLHTILGIQQSKYEIPYSNKIYTQGVSDVTIDYTQDPFYADINYSQNLQDIGMWDLFHGDLEYYQSDNKYLFAKIDLQHRFNDTFSLKFGGDWISFTNKMSNLQQNDIFFNEISNSPQKLIELPETLITPQNKHKNQRWLSINTNDALALYKIAPFNITQNDAFYIRKYEHIKENSQGVYTLLALERDKWEVDFGLRYQFDSITTSTQDLSSISYDLWLPSLNSTLFINEHWRFRFGASKNYSKPLLSSLNFADSNNTLDNIEYIFNPNLKPYISYNTDLSLEGDFSGHSSFDLSLYYKNLNDYIVTTQAPLAYPGKAANDKVAVWQSNAETAYQWGIELNLNYLIPNSDWGINLQSTYNEGRVTYYNSNDGLALFKKNLPFLSKITASTMIFYDRPNLNFKLGAIFRGQYLVRAGGLINDENETGFMPTMYWDASVNYNFTKNWKLKLSAFNLCNEQERQYSDSSLRAYNSTTSGRTFYLGLSYQY